MTLIKINKIIVYCMIYNIILKMYFAKKYLQLRVLCQILVLNFANKIQTVLLLLFILSINI